MNSSPGCGRIVDETAPHVFVFDQDGRSSHSAFCVLGVAEAAEAVCEASLTEPLTQDVEPAYNSLFDCIDLRPPQLWRLESSISSSVPLRTAIIWDLLGSRSSRAQESTMGFIKKSIDLGCSELWGLESSIS